MWVIPIKIVGDTSSKLWGNAFKIVGDTQPQAAKRR